MSVSAPLSDIVAGGRITLRAKCDRCGHEVFIKIEDKNPQFSIKKAMKTICEYNIRAGLELMKIEGGSA
jgi:DNA-directed RNA polymerase subunit RPC12/RpoP